MLRVFLAAAEPLRGGDVLRIVSRVNPIPGLILRRGFVSAAAASDLVKAIDLGQWNCELRRRVQHYGFKYDYRTRHCGILPAVPALPSWAAKLIARIRNAGLVSGSFDQLIINEYLPGQGIAMHVDSPTAFGDEIVSVSLLSSCVLRLSAVRDGRDVSIQLDPGDVLVLSGEARSQWKHGIATRKKDVCGGRTLVRARRLSLTFRQVARGSKTIGRPDALTPGGPAGY
jgi:alkylated DNA repair dioxygenase AlkB